MSTPKRIISEQAKRIIEGKATLDVQNARSGAAVTHFSQPNIELGDLLVDYLEQLGVDYVFGVPGGPIEPLFNALARSERRGGPLAA